MVASATLCRLVQGHKKFVAPAYAWQQQPFTVTIRVLCFGRFYDDIPGGMQRHVESLFASLAGQVQFVHLVPSRDFRSARFWLHGSPVIRTSSLNIDGSLALSPGLITQARRLLRLYDFDLIHLLFPDPMSHIASATLPESIPRIITWHADIVRQKILLRLYRPFLARVLRTAAAIIAPTPAHIKRSSMLSDVVSNSKFQIIPLGVDLNGFIAPCQAAQQIRDRFPCKRDFALVRHVYYKGFDVLISAMSRMGSDTQLLIGGTGPLTEQWKALARAKGVADRVHFLGLLGEKDLPSYYQACDVFCLPAISPAEAFGIVQVEAMACAKPVVSTRLNTGVDYVNQHGMTGLTVPPGDSAALADALNYLLADAGLRARLGAQAQARTLAEFSLEVMG